MARRVKRAGSRRDDRISAADIIEFFDKYIFIPEGRLVGQRLVLDPWQRAEIEKIYDNPNGPTRRAILSMGRKNAKSTLAAGLLLAHLCWPVRKAPAELAAVQHRAVARSGVADLRARQQDG